MRRSSSNGASGLRVPTPASSAGSVSGSTNPPHPHPSSSSSIPTNTFSSALTPRTQAQDAFSTILASQGVLEDDDDDHGQDPKMRAAWLEERGLEREDWTEGYGLLEPGDTVIVRPYGGEDDDILLTELRPRFVVLYEPNLAFIRRLEVSCRSIGKAIKSTSQS